MRDRLGTGIRLVLAASLLASCVPVNSQSSYIETPPPGNDPKEVEPEPSPIVIEQREFTEFGSSGIGKVVSVTPITEIDDSVLDTFRVEIALGLGTEALEEATIFGLNLVGENGQTQQLYLAEIPTDTGEYERVVGFGYKNGKLVPDSSGNVEVFAFLEFTEHATYTDVSISDRRGNLHQPPIISHDNSTGELTFNSPFAEGGSASMGYAVNKEGAPRGLLALIMPQDTQQNRIFNEAIAYEAGQSADELDGIYKGFEGYPDFMVNFVDGNLTTVFEKNTAYPAGITLAELSPEVFNSFPPEVQDFINALNRGEVIEGYPSEASQQMSAEILEYMQKGGVNFVEFSVDQNGVPIAMSDGGIIVSRWSEEEENWILTADFYKSLPGFPTIGIIDFSRIDSQTEKFEMNDGFAIQPFDRNNPNPPVEIKYQLHTLFKLTETESGLVWERTEDGENYEWVVANRVLAQETGDFIQAAYDACVKPSQLVEPSIKPRFENSPEVKAQFICEAPYSDEYGNDGVFMIFQGFDGKPMAVWGGGKIGNESSLRYSVNGKGATSLTGEFKSGEIVTFLIYVSPSARYHSTDVYEFAEIRASHPFAYREAVLYLQLDPDGLFLPSLPNFSN